MKSNGMFMLKMVVYGILLAGVAFCFSEAVHWLIWWRPVTGSAALIILGCIASVLLMPDEDEEKPSEDDPAYTSYMAYLRRKEQLDKIANEEVLKLMVKNPPAGKVEELKSAINVKGCCACECPGGPCGHKWGGYAQTVGVDTSGNITSTNTQVCDICGLFKFDHDYFLVPRKK